MAVDINNAIDEIVKERDWSLIKLAWETYLSERQPNEVSCVPTLTLNALLADGAIFVDPPKQNEITDTAQPRAEIGEVIFSEATYWIHKALHVITAAEIHIQKGLPTWSLSSAYQSAYFSARAVIGFLGIGIAEFEGRTSVLFDLCRDLRITSNSKIAESGAFEDNVRIRSFGVLFDHRQIWYVFQRILRISSCELLDDDVIKFLMHLSVTRITRQRHRLHYQLDYWVVPQDMDTFYCPDDFIDFNPTGKGKKRYDLDKGNFTLSISRDILKMALDLFRDIQSQFSTLERMRIGKITTGERHPYFVSDVELIENSV